jgi:hypothetical protein
MGQLHTQDITHVHEVMLLSPRKSVTQYSQSLGIKRKIHHHAMKSDSVSLQNPSGTDAQCSQQAAETCWDLLQFVQ